ncbi:MAG: type IIL restriction-modification enzyme MmeI, partial [Pirellulales bacterium]
MSDAVVSAFIERWSKSGGAERANYQLFLAELCDVLGVPRPDPTRPDDHENAYVFERNVQFDNLDGTFSTGRIDLYKRACFVLETKQSVEKQDEEQLLSSAALARKKKLKKGHGIRGTSAWNDTLLRARGQAEQYARSLTGPETRPPFLVVVDVGHTIELYAEFTQTGGTYVPFPDPTAYRLRLEQLADAEIRERLKLLWTDPLALDPARRSAKVT